MSTLPIALNTRAHVHQWRELKLRQGPLASRSHRRGEGAFIGCETCGDAQLLAPSALIEFRRQRRRGLEPRFDEEGLVKFVLRARSGPRRNRSREAQP